MYYITNINKNISLKCYNFAFRNQNHIKMETKEMTQTEKTTQNIELVKGAFTRSEASHIVGALIDQKINFHKIQRLQAWEGDHNCKTGGLDNRITELEEQKKIARQFISSYNQSGCSFKIKGTLEIIVEENEL